MPVSNGVASWNIGRDCQVVIQGSRGRIDIPNAMKFDSKQATTNIQKTRLDGNPLNAKIPREWNGSFECDRGSSGLDDEIAIAEAQFRNTGQLSNYTLYQYVQEVNGANSTYQYDGVQIEIDAGSWAGDAEVTQKISFTANTRKKV